MVISVTPGLPGGFQVVHIPYPGLSTEAVDNFVDNMGASGLSAYGVGPKVKLVIFSPA